MRCASVRLFPQESIRFTASLRDSRKLAIEAATPIFTRIGMWCCSSDSSLYKAAKAALTLSAHYNGVSAYSQPSSPISWKIQHVLN